MKMLFSVLLLNYFLLSFIGCNTTEPSDSGLNLSVKEVSSTEVWLKLTAEGLSSSSVININRDKTNITQISNLRRDTTIFIDSLLPNKTYSFEAVLHSNKIVKNIIVTATTLDTTSNNYNWQTFTFGEDGYSSSIINDVAVIDENNIWAVGEIYLKDSLGNPDPHLYNAVHWDGIKWTVKRISVPFSGNPIVPPLEGILTFSPTDIWIKAFNERLYYYFP